MLSGKRILLGITGGIAAYKAAILLRAFKKAGADVRVIMTPGATQFVGTKTFSSLSGRNVAVSIFPEGNNDNNNAWTRHIDWGEWADLFVIAPCTANTLGKIASGLSDNMLTATVLAARCPILICPTMDGEMYQSPAVQQNLETVQEYDYHLLEPETGYLASGLEGKGRLPETEHIIDTSSSIIENEGSSGILSGKKVLVTAGPTREHIDPVRFISNPSTGKMGFAMAEAAQRAGAEVTLIHGPVQLPEPERISKLSIESAKQLFEAVKNHADADIIIMAAAVSDFRPKKQHSQKVKKDSAEDAVAFEQNPDILKWLGKHKKKGQILIGFAMETENLLNNAQKKLTEKKTDWIVANSLTEKDSGFAGDSNTVYLLSRSHRQEISGTKREVARDILNIIFSAE